MSKEIKEILTVGELMKLLDPWLCKLCTENGYLESIAQAIHTAQQNKLAEIKSKLRESEGLG